MTYPSDRPGRLHGLDRADLPGRRPVLGARPSGSRITCTRRSASSRWGTPSTHFDWVTAIVGTLAGAGGIGLSYVMYAEPSPIPGRLAERLRPLYEASLHKFYVDEIYEWVVVRPTRALAVVCEFLDDLPGGSAGASASPGCPGCSAASVLARYQNGLIQFYAAVSALSVAVLLLILLFFSS